MKTEKKTNENGRQRGKAGSLHVLREGEAWAGATTIQFRNNQKTPDGLVLINLPFCSQDAQFADVRKVPGRASSLSTPGSLLLQ